MKERQLPTELSHYRIISKIGEGGMGQVYLAEDTKLDRKVAIKFLSDKLSHDPDKLKRFIREARAASALNHPNILTVYEIGEVDGQNYIATELIDGQTLRALLQQQEPIPLNEILKIGVQIAEALSAAHEAGIIHRDIKPENIMIRRDGYAKVLDFGLAKLSQPQAEASGSEDATRFQVNTHPGMVMGTVFYMSPEQARGNATDGRTDIWSLGVVLYEILAGRVPFAGESVNHTLVEILDKEPAIPRAAPPELQRIVRKALTKNVAMRYQSSRDLLIDLQNLHRELDLKAEIERSVVPARETANGALAETQTRIYEADATRSDRVTPTEEARSTSSLEYAVSQARRHKVATGAIFFALIVITTFGYLLYAAGSDSAARQINSIAVMPFVNASGNSEVEYLSDGLTDSLIFRFSQLPNVKISPTSSVMRYKGSTKDVTAIAGELDVDAVLTGRLMQVGDNLSISVQLIDSRTQKLVWAEQYDRKMADLLATQREIATTLTQKMQLGLAGDQPGITKKYTSSNEAYQLYLKGRYHWSRRTKDELNKAIDNYKKAIELDPNFALAFAAIAEAYNSIGKNPEAAPKDCIPFAKAAAMRALEIDPTLPEAHSALGDSLAIYDWNWADSESHFKKALALDPNISYTHLVYGVSYLNSVGQPDQGLAEAQKAVELEPLSLINNSVAVIAYLNARQFEQALAQAQTAVDLDPGFPLARHWLGFALVANGKLDEAIVVARQTSSNPLADWMSLVVLGHAYAKQGNRTAAEEQITHLRDLSKRQYVRPYYLASIYAMLGERDKAFEELERSFAERDCYLGRITVDPFMDPLRNDPRFKRLTQRMDLSR